MHDVHVLLHFTWSYKILIAKIANSSLFFNIFSQIVNLKILSIHQDSLFFARNICSLIFTYLCQRCTRTRVGSWSSYLHTLFFFSVVALSPLFLPSPMFELFPTVTVWSWDRWVGSWGSSVKDASERRWRGDSPSSSPSGTYLRFTSFLAIHKPGHGRESTCHDSYSLSLHPVFHWAAATVQGPRSWWSDGGGK
jgi:hypothetical protein